MTSPRIVFWVAIPGLSGDVAYRSPGESGYGKVKIIVSKRQDGLTRIYAWPLSDFSREAGADFLLWYENDDTAFTRTHIEWVRIITQRREQRV